MKIRFLVALLAMVTALHSDEHADNGWTVLKNSTPLSNLVEFSIQKGEQTLGYVERSGLFTPRYCYDLYNRDGELTARGITRVVSFSRLFVWGTEIDLYDGSEQIGLISGEFWSNSKAKFAFYESSGKVVAYALLSDSSNHFVLVSGESNGEPIAVLEGEPYGDVGVWKMKPKCDSLGVDEKALFIFAAFAADYQKSFIKRSRVVAIYPF